MWHHPFFSPLPLGTPPNGDPFEEALHARAFAPQQREEFLGVEVRRFMSEKRFEAPADVGRLPRAQSVAFRDDPVIPQCVQHGESENGKGKMEKGNRDGARDVDGRIAGQGASAAEAVRILCGLCRGCPSALLRVKNRDLQGIPGAVRQ